MHHDTKSTCNARDHRVIIINTLEPSISPVSGACGEEARAAQLSPEAAEPTSRGGAAPPGARERNDGGREETCPSALAREAGDGGTSEGPGTGQQVNTGGGAGGRNTACTGGLSGTRGRHSQRTSPAEGRPHGVHHRRSLEEPARAPPTVPRRSDTNSAPGPAKPSEAALWDTPTLGAVHTDTQTREHHLSRAPRESAARAEGRGGTLGWG